MATKKDLVIAATATFCLTVTLLLVIPSRSQNDRYNPWLDYNEDGLINIVDITNAAVAFGASGDPTKQVVVSGYGNVENIISFTLLNQTLTNITVSTAGYRTISLSLFAQSKDAHVFEIFWGFKIAGKFAYSTIQGVTSDTTVHVVFPIWYKNVRSPQFLLTMQIDFSEFWLSINNNSTDPDKPLMGSVVYSLNA